MRRLLADENISVPGMAGAVDAIRAQGCTNVEDILAADLAPGLQRRLTDPISKKQRQDFLNGAPRPRQDSFDLPGRRSCRPSHRLVVF